MTLVRDVAGMAALAGLHDAVLLDQFGVLHDGARAFPGAVDCVTRLRAGGARIAIVSNSGKRAAPNRARLAALGFAPSLFDAVITSGEICRDLLAAEIAAGRLAQGGRIFVLARGADRSALEGLDLRATSDPTDADALLIAGAEPERCALEAYAALLAPLAARRAPRAMLLRQPRPAHVCGERRDLRRRGGCAGLCGGGRAGALDRQTRRGDVRRRARCGGRGRSGARGDGGRQRGA